MRWRERAAWLALAIAFSPAWIELAQHLQVTRADRYVVVPCAALACLLWHERKRPPARVRPQHAALVGAAAALLLLTGIAGSASLFSRLSLPVAAFALAAWLGRPRPEALVIAVTLLPLPGSLLHLSSPGLESRLGALAAAVVSAVGLDVTAVGPLLRSPRGDALELIPHDGGLHLALILATLGWACALFTGASTRDAAFRALRFAAFTLVAQPAALLLAAVLVACGAPIAARALLSVLVFAVAALGAVIYTAGSSPAMHSSTART